VATTAFVKAQSAGGGVYIQDTAPATTVPAGSLWWNSTNGQLFVLYNDGDSTQWVFAVSVSAVNWMGVTDGSAATAGQIGECITNAAFGVTASNGIITNVCSITLTPGDWDVSATANFAGGPATVQQLSAGLSTTSASMPAQNLANVGLTNYFQFGAFTSMYNVGLPIPPYRFSVTVNTVVYLVMLISANAGTATFNGRIQARRMR
jgi:hypothetical protein